MPSSIPSRIPKRKLSPLRGRNGELGKVAGCMALAYFISIKRSCSSWKALIRLFAAAAANLPSTALTDVANDAAALAAALAVLIASF